MKVNSKSFNKASKRILYTVWVSNRNQKGIIEGLAFYILSLNDVTSKLPKSSNIKKSNLNSNIKLNLDSEQ